MTVPSECRRVQILQTLHRPREAEDGGSGVWAESPSSGALSGPTDLEALINPTLWTGDLATSPELSVAATISYAALLCRRVRLPRSSMIRHTYSQGFASAS